MKTMISPQQADTIIKQTVKKFPVINLPLQIAYGLVLQEDIKAERDAPAFDKALMDGIALKYTSYKKGVRKFLVEGIQPAGKAALTLKFANGCTEIMTGAVLTKGCDCIIPIEHVAIKEGKALVKDGLVLLPMQHVRKKGADHKKGKLLVKKGSRLYPPQVAIAAACGKAQVKVSAKPRVAVVSSGDELVDIGANIKPYQIRKSNSYFIEAALNKTGLFQCAIFQFPDNEQVLRKQIGALMAEFDAMVLTGGVSMGKFDLIPKVMKQLSVKVLFHKVKQKPGKPFWFGKTKTGKPVFALPGNPVSTQVGTYRYVIPHLSAALGYQPKPTYVKLKSAYKPDTAFSYFLPVKVKSNKQGVMEATPIITGGSGDFSALSNTDGFIQLSANLKAINIKFIERIYYW